MADACPFPSRSPECALQLGSYSQLKDTIYSQDRTQMSEPALGSDKGKVTKYKLLLLGLAPFMLVDFSGLPASWIPVLKSSMPYQQPRLEYISYTGVF